MLDAYSSYKLNLPAEPFFRLLDFGELLKDSA